MSDDQERTTAIDVLCRELEHKRKMIDALMQQSVTLQLRIEGLLANNDRMRVCLLDIRSRTSTRTLKAKIDRALAQKELR